MRATWGYLSSLIALVSVCLPLEAQVVVPAGYDMFKTDTNTSWDFSSAPIPADFFDPGSQPFDGVIPLQGVPLETTPLCPGTGLGDADTIVQRMEAADLSGLASFDTVPIEIVALHLVSVAPITVSY
ncbi:MAG: hypothetical protein HYV26_10205 [Candidatus Hydrogenedentes bacterium]|nr:hypothetical protein [Candidatus Hydrogenedentota bacterium]